MMQKELNKIKQRQSPEKKFKDKIKKAILDKYRPAITHKSIE